MRTLRFWKWKLRATSAPAAGATPVNAVSFVELVGTPASAPVLELVLPGGYRIGVAPGFDAGTLRTLLTVLEAPR